MMTGCEDIQQVSSLVIDSDTNDYRDTAAINTTTDDASEEDGDDGIAVGN